MRGRKLNAEDSTVVVTGPGCEGRNVPNVGCGIGLAQYLAGQRDEGTWYVRDGDAVKARVEITDTAIVTVAS